MCTDLPWGAQGQGNVNRMNQAHHFLFKKNLNYFRGKNWINLFYKITCSVHRYPFVPLAPNNTDQQFSTSSAEYYFLTLYSGHMTCKKSNSKAFNRNKRNRKWISKCRTASTGAMTTHFQIRGRCSVGPPETMT